MLLVKFIKYNLGSVRPSTKFEVRIGLRVRKIRRI